MALQSSLQALLTPTSTVEAKRKDVKFVVLKVVKDWVTG